MSYPRDLDDYSDKELTAEIERRLVCRRQGFCDYCMRKSDTEDCRYPARHHFQPELYKSAQQ